jgi:hypothetical protein
LARQTVLRFVIEDDFGGYENIARLRSALIIGVYSRAVISEATAPAPTIRGNDQKTGVGGSGLMQTVVSVIDHRSSLNTGRRTT